MDFTLKIYRQLLLSLQNVGFSFITFSEYVESEKLKTKTEKLLRPDNPETNKELRTTNKEQQTNQSRRWKVLGTFPCLSGILPALRATLRDLCVK
jgi:hypothetical protein